MTLIQYYEETICDPTVIVVRCVDRRFRNAHREFLQKELSLLSGDCYYPIKVAGGAGGLARPEDMPHEFSSIYGQIELFTGHHNIQTIVLISHEDCRRYDKIERTSPQMERDDLVKAKEMISEKLPSIRVLAFYGRFADINAPPPRKIYFEEV